VFGVLAFALNFIPNIGMLTSVVLPMPLVLLEPSFTPLQALFAFLGPLFVGTVCKDVLEPLVIGKATTLHPVAVLLCIMLFGSVWGIVGMVMAIPITAVVRIVLMNIEHPLTRLVADVLGGTQHRFEQRSVPML
jgi:AI-2 transport protein TqsA